MGSPLLLWGWLCGHPNLQVDLGSVHLSVDHSRIKLHQEDNDYINASLIKMEEAQRSYILTQVDTLSEIFFDVNLRVVSGLYLKQNLLRCLEVQVFKTKELRKEKNPPLKIQLVVTLICSAKYRRAGKGTVRRSQPSPQPGVGSSARPGRGCPADSRRLTSVPSTSRGRRKR